jgi:hypothetical protein
MTIAHSSPLEILYSPRATNENSNKDVLSIKLCLSGLSSPRPHEMILNPETAAIHAGCFIIRGEKIGTREIHILSDYTIRRDHHSKKDLRDILDSVTLVRRGSIPRFRSSAFSNTGQVVESRTRGRSITPWIGVCGLRGRPSWVAITPFNSRNVVLEYLRPFDFV